MFNDVFLHGGVMKKRELQELLFTMTEEELRLKEQQEKVKKLPGLENLAYSQEGEVYVFVERGLAEAPVSIPGYENAAKHFEFLNIVGNKHTRYAEVPMHRHEFVEMNFILSGNVRFVVNGKEVEMKQGTIGIMDSNVVHQVMNTTEDDVMLNIMMPKRYFDTTFMTTLMGVELATSFLGDVMSEKTKHDRYLVMNCQDSETIENLFLNVFCEFLEPKVGSANMIRCYIGSILIEAMRNYQENYVSAKRAKGEQNDVVVMDILHYIDEHCTTCTLQEVADYYNYSVTHLSRKIKKTVGKSFQALISEQRLNRVALQLENTDASITQIAASCGYQNMAFFYQKFAEQFGMTPKEYRQKLRGLT